MVPIGTIANLAPTLDELGIDGWAFMQQYGIGPAAFARPLEQVPLSLCGAMLRDAVLLARRDDLPLLLAAKARLENVGPLRLLVASSLRVRDALRALVRFRTLWYSDFRVALTEEGRLARLTVDLAGDFVGQAEIRVSYLGALCRHVAAIAGRGWRPTGVTMTRARPADVTPYRLHFGVLPEFRSARDAILFERRWLDAKCPVSADTDIHDFLRRQLSNLEAALGSRFPEQISELIETLLIGGGCSVEKVAGVLGMSRVTLYRRLDGEATTFTKLLEASRRRMAERMLAQRTAAIAEIATALGYTTPANFTRAFRAWTGTTPAQWRREGARDASRTASHASAHDQRPARGGRER